MQQNKYAIASIIGRLSPPHIAHFKMIKYALTVADQVLILLGSVKRPRDIKNPFPFEERCQMILLGLTPDEQKRVIFRGLEDSLYSNAKWSSQVQGHITEVAGNNSVCVVGYKKDESTFYLDLFPQWPLVEFGRNGSSNFFDGDSAVTFSSTQVRAELFRAGAEYFNKTGRHVIAEFVPKPVVEFLVNFTKSAEYPRLVREWDHFRKYKKAWEAAPYPPIFVTADTVVEQSGHVLLVERKAAPGEGLFALPGGFVNQHETVECAAIRELREETKLKVPEPVLRGSIKSREVFDSPYRSLRGRTITHAFHIKLPDGPLPKVKGSDDAKQAFWLPLHDLKSENIFEDHFSIIVKMIGI